MFIFIRCAAASISGIKAAIFYTKLAEKNALKCSFSKGPVQVSIQIASVADDSACRNLCLRPNFSADPGSGVK